MDKKLKQLKETWNRLDEFMKVHDYRDGSYFGSGTYSFKIGEHNYVMGADEFKWKGFMGLDVSFGIMKIDDEIGHYVDYESNINEVDATDVIATVLDMTFRMAEKEMPEKWLLSFNPTKDRYDGTQEGGDTKRSKLYQRITKRMAKKYGWKMTDVVRIDQHNVGFIIQKSSKEIEEGKIGDWFSKQKSSVKDALWKTYQELLETKEAGIILKKLVSGQETTKKELEFLKIQALDVLRGLGLGAITAVIPGGMGIVFLLKKIGDKVGLEVLPSSFKKDPEI